MGICLFLETNNGSAKFSIHFKRFYRDLFQFDTEIIPHKNFLTEDQIDLLIPDLDEENTLYRRNAESFKFVIQLLQSYLKTNDSKLPMFHWFMQPSGNSQGSSQIFENNGEQVYLNGIHTNSEKRDFVQLRQLNGSAVNFEWIKAKSQIELNGIKFNIRSKTMSETHNENLEEIIAVCDIAIHKKEQLFWSISF